MIARILLTTIALTAGVTDIAAPPMRLAGTVVDGANRQAIVQSGRTWSTIVPGDEWAGWTVLGIEPGRVTLDGPTGPRELWLGEQSGAEPVDPAWSWDNPCGRLHRPGRAGMRVHDPRRCASADLLGR